MPARAALALVVLAAAAPLASSAEVGARDATTRDNVERSRGAGTTEWWFTGVIDPVSGEAFAASLGTRMASGPPATAVLSLPLVGHGDISPGSHLVEVCRLDLPWRGEPVVVTVHTPPPPAVA